MRRDQGTGVQLDRVRAAGAVPGRSQRGLPQVSPRQAQSQVLSIVRSKEVINALNLTPPTLLPKEPQNARTLRLRL